MDGISAAPGLETPEWRFRQLGSSYHYSPIFGRYLMYRYLYGLGSGRLPPRDSLATSWRGSGGFLEYLGILDSALIGSLGLVYSKR